MPWLAPVLAYLAGSIPFGLLVARARGVDIREVGSGNIGATNVGRALGKKYAYLVFALDFGKGILGVWLARRVIGDALPSLPWWIVSSALATVLGHSFPIWLKFKGGKGVATSAGALFYLCPMAVLIAIAVWALLFLATRFVSVASLAAALALPLAMLVVNHDASLAFVGLGFVLAALVWIRHIPNIRALLAGTERRFTKERAP